MRPQALLWDMDGLLVDSEPLWTAAEHELAARHGRAFTREMKAAIVGTRLEVAVPTLLTLLGQEATTDRVAETADWLLGRMVELFGGDLPLRPGAAALLAEAAAAGVPQALVSSSYRVLVDAVLAQGVGPFAVTVAGDEVTRGKPEPEPYLTAAGALGVDPACCVVLEDSPAGVLSGTAAGCAVVAVPDVAGAEVLPAPRRLVLRSLQQVDLDVLDRLVGEPA